MTTAADRTLEAWKNSPTRLRLEELRREKHRLERQFKFDELKAFWHNSKEHPLRALVVLIGLVYGSAFLLQGNWSAGFIVLSFGLFFLSLLIPGHMGNVLLKITCLPFLTSYFSLLGFFFIWAWGNSPILTLPLFLVWGTICTIWIAKPRANEYAGREMATEGENIL
jgi:hypothetical protein